TVRFSNFGAGTLTTDASGNLSVSSDERLKNIDGSFTRGLSDIMKLSPISYHWNTLSGLDMTTGYSGFSAQNVQTAIPEAVGSSTNGFLTLQDRPILAATVNAIKDIGSITGIFKDNLIAWLGNTSNGITSIFAQNGNFNTTNTQTICVDGECLTKSDVHTLLQMVQAQNGIGGSSGPTNVSPDENSTDSTSTPQTTTDDTSTTTESTATVE
ncbi:MAG: hypothetical protein JWO50_125, partial [Candidatus Kaiserbacteria bacterium]|nr:hypothetical protein [Candidatus Kaiserbacteria bacterium]